MTEPACLAAIRESYDTVAAAYAARVPPPAELDPLSRAVLAEFAGLVRAGGPVADVGCGPGKVTAHLADLGVAAFGIDLSPRMIRLARPRPSRNSTARWPPAARSSCRATRARAPASPTRGPTAATR